MAKRKPPEQSETSPVKKAFAVKRLRDCLSEIPKIQKGNAFSVEFKDWNRRTIAALEQLHGQTGYWQNFAALRFWNTRIRDAYSDGDGWEPRDQATYERDLQSGQRIITDALEEFDYEQQNSIPEELITHAPVLKAQPQGTPPDTATHPNVDSRKVFVVHGHDAAPRDALARALQKLELEPVILHEMPNGMRTVIDKFQHHSSDVAFAVVLLTADDVGTTAPQFKIGGASAVRPRARQNVVFELGYFVARLGSRVVAVLGNGVEMPSDLAGVVYIPLDDHEAWLFKIAKEIQNAGISIDLNKL